MKDANVSNKRLVFNKRKLLIGFLIFINILILIGIGFLVAKNLNLNTSTPQVDNNSSDIVAKISKLATLDNKQIPQVATINDVEKLKSGNAIQAEVYKDVKDGDYLLAYTDKYIIYRESENKIIYNGDSPNKILTDTQKKVSDKIALLANTAKILTVDNGESPQLTAVNDSILQNKSSSEFYSQVVKDDIIALFSTNQVIVIYRPSSDNLISMGSYETIIHVLNK